MGFRVLHVLGGMNRGGAETWLMHVLRHVDRRQFHMDFLVHTTDPCVYDDEIRALGSEVIPCLRPSRPWMYARNFRRILREHGPYDVVHSHVHHFSGLVLKLAEAAGVPGRIAHSHNDTSSADRRTGLLRRAYLTQTAHWIRKHATAGVAASRKAAEALYGKDWQTDPRWSVLHCGVDLDPFREPVDREAVRAELGIPGDALVVGHAGRFFSQKNHRFLVEIAASLFRREPGARLLLIGDGPDRAEIEGRVAQRGIADRVIFAGLRPDVPRLMLGAMDVFVMPSLYEGLPLVGIEAQAAGLPCILSDVITDELDAGQTLVVRLGLDAEPARWAAAILDAANRRIDARAGVEALTGSTFDIRASAAALCDLHAAAASPRLRIHAEGAVT